MPDRVVLATLPTPTTRSCSRSRTGSQARLGQSVAAALLANGIRTLRIDEAGNPKGILCGIGYCFECRCVIDDEPDRRACMVEAKPGMQVRRQQGLA